MDILMTAVADTDCLSRALTFKNLRFTTTDYVATWGALTGSLVLLWDVIKWFRKGAKLKVKVRPNTFYHDGEVIKVEKTEHGEVTTHALYYHIEVVNVGSQPTTILSIEATTKPVGLEKMRKKQPLMMGYSDAAFVPHQGKKLPQVVGPGEVWSCRLNEARIEDMSNHGNPKIVLYAAHRDKPIYIRINKPANKSTKSGQ